jgi:hypothetical protein
MPHKLVKTTGAFAALFDFGAVGVKDPIVKIQIWIIRRLDHQQLVETHAKIAVGQRFDLLFGQEHILADGIDHHKIVAQPMHFRKL